MKKWFGGEAWRVTKRLDEAWVGLDKGCLEHDVRFFSSSRIVLEY